MADDLHPSIAKRDLPPEVASARARVEDEFARREQGLAPAVAAHVSVYGEGIERLVSIHSGIADGTDIELGSDTRWSAIWELSGRCLSECRVLLHALRGGFSVECASMERAVFEAMYLLSAVAFDDQILAEWLRGDYIKPSRARAAMTRRQELARQRMEELGIESDADVKETGDWLYDQFSQSAHHRRGAITRSISLERREFSYGPHRDPDRRATDLVNAGHTIDTALIVIAASLADIVGKGDLGPYLEEQAKLFEKVRQMYPLSE